MKIYMVSLFHRATINNGHYAITFKVTDFDTNRKFICNRADHIYFHPVVSFFFYLFLFLASSQPSEIGCLPYFHTWCGLSANLECMSEMCCTWFAESTGRKNDAKNRHLGTIAQLCRAISSQLRHASTIGKKTC